MNKVLLIMLFFFYQAFALRPKIGVDYTVIGNKKVKVSKPVHVKEFFSFTCIHCKELEPLLENYFQTHKNVVLDKIQVLFDNSPQSIALAKLNATLQNLNLTNLYIPFFTAVFTGNNITTKSVMSDILQKQHLSTTQIQNFFDVYNSFSTASTINRYRTLTADPKYHLSGTPTIVVGDKYILSPAQPSKLINVLSSLVNKV